LAKRETKFDGLRLNVLTITSIFITKTESSERELKRAKGN